MLFTKYRFQILNFKELTMEYKKENKRPRIQLA